MHFTIVKQQTIVNMLNNCKKK